MTATQGLAWTALPEPDSNEFDQRKSALSKILAAENKELVEGLDARGNCQFDTLAYAVNALGSDKKWTKEDMRVAVCDHMSKFPDRYEDFAVGDRQHSWDRYIELMRKAGYWGDHTSLQAAADLFHRDIVVRSSAIGMDNRRLVSSKLSAAVPCKFSSPVSNAIVVAHISEAHYMPISSKNTGDCSPSSAQGIGSGVPATGGEQPKAHRIVPIFEQTVPQLFAVARGVPTIDKHNPHSAHLHTLIDIVKLLVGARQLDLARHLNDGFANRPDGITLSEMRHLQLSTLYDIAAYYTGAPKEELVQQDLVVFCYNVYSVVRKWLPGTQDPLLAIISADSVLHKVVKKAIEIAEDSLRLQLCMDPENDNFKALECMFRYAIDGVNPNLGSPERTCHLQQVLKDLLTLEETYAKKDLPVSPLDPTLFKSGDKNLIKTIQKNIDTVESTMKPLLDFASLSVAFKNMHAAAERGTTDERLNNATALQRLWKLMRAVSTEFDVEARKYPSVEQAVMALSAASSYNPQVSPDLALLLEFDMKALADDAVKGSRTAHERLVSDSSGEKALRCRAALRQLAKVGYQLIQICCSIKPTDTEKLMTACDKLLDIVYGAHSADVLLAKAAALTVRNERTRVDPGLVNKLKEVTTNQDFKSLLTKSEFAKLKEDQGRIRAVEIRSFSAILDSLRKTSAEAWPKEQQDAILAGRPLLHLIHLRLIASSVKSPYISNWFTRKAAKVGGGVVAAVGAVGAITGGLAALAAAAVIEVGTLGLATLPAAALAGGGITLIVTGVGGVTAASIRANVMLVYENLVKLLAKELATDDDKKAMEADPWSVDKCERFICEHWADIDNAWPFTGELASASADEKASLRKLRHTFDIFWRARRIHTQMRSLAVLGMKKAGKSSLIRSLYGHNTKPGMDDHTAFTHWHPVNSPLCGPYFVLDSAGLGDVDQTRRSRFTLEAEKDYVTEGYLLMLTANGLDHSEYLRDEVAYIVRQPLKKFIVINKMDLWYSARYATNRAQMSSAFEKLKEALFQLVPSLKVATDIEYRFSCLDMKAEVTDWRDEKQADFKEWAKANGIIVDYAVLRNWLDRALLDGRMKSRH